MTPEELLQRWKTMSGDASGKAWAPENAYGFFSEFCRRERELRRALEGVPRAAAIAERLRGVFNAAGASEDDAYLVVHHPPRLDDERAITLARRHLKALGALLGHCVLWRLARRRSDPSAAYFELWRHGIVLRWRGAEVVNIHLPGTAGSRSLAPPGSTVRMWPASRSKPGS